MSVYIPRQQPGVLLVLGGDPRSGHAHEEGDEEEAQEHDGGEEELTLVHGVQAHLDWSLGALVVIGRGDVLRELEDRKETKHLQIYIF